jgi:Dehydrogenases (flavoproteins)
MNYTMQTRSIPYDDSWDVIVVGGGPAGVTAAAAAARDGARTLLIEATGCLGGMSTMGLVPAWCPFSDKEKIIYCGLAERIFTASKAAMPFLNQAQMDWVPIDPEKMKVIYDDLMDEFGVTVLFNTVLSGVDTSDGKVTALLVTNKNGLTAYTAKVYIDCSGDGDLAAWAGAEFQIGDDDDDSLQPATHCFSLGNVKYDVYSTGISLHNHNKESPIHQIVASDKYPLVTDQHFCNNTVYPGTVGFNAGHIDGVNGTDPFSLSKALMTGRKKADQVRQALSDYYPEAFGDAYVSLTAPLMGIRETRRIVGDYTLSIEDFLERRSFPDEISRNSYYIDIHRNRKEFDKTKTNVTEAHHYGKGESHGIPYRCLTPKGIENLLVAGRSISCDRYILGSVRVMPNCLTTGEAAGCAAAMAAKADNNVHTVDTDELRSTLKDYGGYFN